MARAWPLPARRNQRAFVTSNVDNVPCQLSVENCSRRFRDESAGAANSANAIAASA